MENRSKRWYDIALDQIRALLDSLPTSDAKLHETLKKRSTAILYPLNRIDELMKLLKNANHDIPLGERRRVEAKRIETIEELRRFAIRVKSFDHKIN